MSDNTASSSDPRSEKRANVITAIVAVALVGALVSVSFVTCGPDDRLRDARDRFFEPLAAGDVEGAYARLSAERRRHMSLEQFGTFIDHPAWSDPDGGTYEKPYEYRPGWCMAGRIDLPNGQWKIELFFVEEDEQMRVHALALQPPARVPLAKLLPECGHHEGTRAGYSGPAIERATVPTRQ